jgi:SAM-dependent methyltransferase
MDKLIKLYAESYAKHGNSLQTLFNLKGRHKERFDAITKYVKSKESVLDYGCGFGHLKSYFDQNNNTVKYSGCDIMKEFVNENNAKISNSFFHIQSHKDVNQNYDHIILVTVFNLLYRQTSSEQYEDVKEVLTHLFSKTNKVLSVDFMTDQVDFVGANSYHQNLMKFYSFCFEKLTRRIVIDQSYMPYEYTVHLFKDDVILRPDNIFNPY